MISSFGYAIAAIIVIMLVIAFALWRRRKGKMTASLERDEAAHFDWLPGGYLTANQIDCICDALAAIDDAREDAPPGSPIWTALDRLHKQADALVSASVK